MSLKIIHKHSSVEGQPPASTDLANGELGVNLNANDPALYLKDSSGAVRRLAGENSASFPEAPDDGNQYARESKSWQIVADKGVAVDDAPPANPSEGALWYDSGDTTALYIWYTDNNSSQWVPVAPDSGGGSGGASVTTSANPPAGAVEGDMWWDSSDGAGSNGGRLYLFYDGQWVQTSNVGGIDSGGGGTSYWERTGTTLSPANAGDDIEVGNVFSGSGAGYVQNYSAGQISLRYDGASTNGGLQMLNGGDGSGSVKTWLKNDGSATFSGDVISGPNPSLTNTVIGTRVTQGRIVLRNDPNEAILTGVPNLDAVAPTVEIKASGRATFTEVDVTQTGLGYTYIGRQANGAATFSVDSDGTIVGKNVTFSLGTGGTLDVKERLQNTQAVLLKLKAALSEPNDDVNQLRARLLDALENITEEVN